ncbi:MAG: LysR family transcriptional regulator [Duodenibacillus sp.]|nr:LysR family transcriptional regulator [Duodenibacillus sp.]
MELTTKSVKLFCAIAETGSLASAANQNAISPSAASRKIQALEARLGFELFARKGKSLVMTEQGQEFYRHAIESIRAWKSLEDYSRVHRSCGKRQLRIAVLSRHASDVILPAVVQVLKDREATLQVTMELHQSRDIHYSKFSHPFDIGFGTLLTRHDDMQKVALAHLPFCLVVHRDNHLAGHGMISADDVRDEDFIVLSHDTPESDYAEGLLPLQPRIAAEVSSTQVALRFVARGVGVHFTDRLAALSVSADCEAMAIDSPLTIPFYVFWPRTAQELTPEMRELTSAIALGIRNAGFGLTQEGLSFLPPSTARR